MHRVKQIKEIFRGFSLDKAAFSIVHINGDKGKAHFPFVIHPECADKCLQDPPRADQVHDQDEQKTKIGGDNLRTVEYDRSAAVFCDIQQRSNRSGSRFL